MRAAVALRNQRDALWDFVLRGLVDIVASDHSPCPPAMKQKDSFFAIWGGIAGIQSTLAVLLQRGLQLSDIARLTATNPAKRFGIADRGALQVGNKADLVLLDIAMSYTLQPDELLQRHRVSPYLGHRFQGVVRQTYRDGELIFSNGKVVSETRGKLVRPIHAKSGTHA